MKKFRFFSMACAAALVLSACSSDEGGENQTNGPKRIAWPAADREGLVDGELPPFELKDESFLGTGRFNSVFWLDFDGARVEAKDSFIVANTGKPTVQVPTFSPSDIRSSQSRLALKRDIVEALLPKFADADIRFTLQRPTGTAFSRVHIGGKNFTGKPRVLGIAPLDLGNRLGNDVLFVFSKELTGFNGRDAFTELIHVIAHEVAHAVGARHIDSNTALMKPSVAVQANSFDVTGPVTDAPDQKENSLQVILNNSGLRSNALVDRELPEIVNLGAFSSGGIIQYSVLCQDNFDRNPSLKLADYTYEWSFEGKETSGTSVLMSFDDKGDHLLTLRVRNEAGLSRSFEFLVGRRR